MSLDFFALNFALFKITFVSEPTYKQTQIASAQFLKKHPLNNAFSFEICTFYLSMNMKPFMSLRKALGFWI